MPDQFSLGSEGWVDDHHELLAVDQKVLKSGVGLFSVEGVRVKEVVPNEAFGRVECLAKGVLNDYFRYQIRILPATVHQGQEEEIYMFLEEAQRLRGSRYTRRQ